jgi:hypothetical protein
MTMYPNYEFLKEARLELPKGWIKLGCELLHEFHDLKTNKVLSPTFSVLQMKEKYGDLVVYCSEESLIVKKLIEGFMEMAGKTCQDCGYYPAKLCERRSWMRTLCKNCSERDGFNSAEGFGKYLADPPST